MKLYKDKICSNNFSCQDYKTFNKENLNKNYKNNFLKDLIEKKDKNIIFRDKTNNILIKILKD